MLDRHAVDANQSAHRVGGAHRDGHGLGGALRSEGAQGPGCVVGRVGRPRAGQTTTDKMAEDVEDPQLSHTPTGTQKWVLVITVFAFD